MLVGVPHLLTSLAHTDMHADGEHIMHTIMEWSILIVYRYFRKLPYAFNEWHYGAGRSPLTNGRVSLTFHQSEYYSYNYLLTFLHQTHI